MRHKTLALIAVCASFAGLAYAEVAGLAYAEVAVQGRPQVLTRSIRAGMAYEDYLQLIMRPVRPALRAKGYLEKADIDRANEKATAQARASAVMGYLIFDRNGDGRVTAEEISEVLSQPGEGGFQIPRESAADSVRRRVAELMKADANGDGAVDYAEMRALADKGVPRGRPDGGLAEYVALAPDGRLTAPALLAMAREAFEAADTDHDTVISEGEAKAFNPPPEPAPIRVPGDRGFEPPREEACKLPPVIAGSRLVLYGTGGGTKQASVSLAGDDGDVTNVAEVRIEPGEEPLYVVLTSYSSMLWRFTGDVDRVVRVAATSTRRADNSGAGKGGSGVTGIPKERVSFLASWNCLREFRELGGIDEAKARGSLADLVGRQPDVKGAAGVTGTLSIPSMKVDAGERRPAWDALPVVDVDPGSVVAAVPVKRFDVLPGRPGLAQLVERGNLERLPQNGGYRIVRTFPRFPTGLAGGIQPSFLLGKGVEMPGGSPGWACVISEETGKPVGSGSPLCR